MEKKKSFIIMIQSNTFSFLFLFLVFLTLLSCEVYGENNIGINKADVENTTLQDNNDNQSIQISPEDHQEILDLIYTYSYTYDSKDLDSFISLFTNDCTWEVYSDKGTELEFQAKNRNQLKEAMQERMANMTEKGIQTRHYQTNTILKSISADTVEGVTMLNLMWQYPDNDLPTFVQTGVYHDEFVKIKGVWKFAKRTALIDQKQSD